MKEIRENIKKSYEESKRIIQDANVEQRLVLFVGAGTSMDSGMPSWGSAIKEIAKRLDITENDKLDYLRIPQYYYNSRGKKEYTQLMRNIFRVGEDLETKPIHKKIMEMGAQTIITTNYDHLIEKAAEDSAVVLDVVCRNEDLPYRKGGKELIKIHGDFEHDNFVLKEEDYLAYSRSFGLIEDYVKSLIGTKVVLLLGYSFNDPDVKQIFDWAKDILKDDFQRAYLINLDDEYDPIEEEYYKRFGINVLYASIMVENIEKYRMSERLLKMLDWLETEEKKPVLDQIHYKLSPFLGLNYAYGRYITSAFGELRGVQCFNGVLACLETADQSVSEILFGIAYSISRRNAGNCYVYVKNEKKDVKIPEKYKNERNEIIDIITALEKSAINRLELSMPVDKDFPWIEDENHYWNSHRVIVEIVRKDNPQWIEALQRFDYRKLKEIEEYNDIKLSNDDPDLYLEQASIAYFRKNYIKAYKLLRTYSMLQYKRHNYAKYFFAKTSQKFIGKFISSRYFVLGIPLQDKNVIAKETDAIDLDRTYRSLPDLGSENKVFKDLYTFGITHSLFQDAYKTSQKVTEQAQTVYTFFAGTPAFYIFKKTIIDFYHYVVENAILLDEYREISEIFKLYFANMLLSASAPDKTPFGKTNLHRLSLPQGNVHAGMLDNFDIYIAAKYMGVDELKKAFSTIKRNLEFSDKTQEYITEIIINSAYEPSQLNDHLIWKLVCIMGYSSLTYEMIDATFGVLNAYTSGQERGDNWGILNRFFVNIDKQRLFTKNNAKLLVAFVDGEIDYLINDIRQLHSHELFLMNAIYFCQKYGKPYDKLTKIKSFYKKESEIFILECYQSFGDKIKKYLKEQYNEWNQPIDSGNFRVYFELVRANIIKPNKRMEHDIYKYYPNTIKEHHNGVILESDNENAICSSLLELYLQEKVVDVPKLKKFINTYGDEDHKWLIDPRKYDYANFKVIWLKKCSNSLCQELAKDEIVREAVSKIIRNTYLKDGLEDDMLGIYFNYFAKG